MTAAVTVMQTHGMLWGATTRAWGGNRPGAPLEALRIHGLEPSVCLLTQFSGTLRHLVLPDLSLNGVYALRPVLTNLPLLEVRLPAGLVSRLRLTDIGLTSMHFEDYYDK